ncbi:MAG: alpha/beta fold hydrolase [Gammaproteobacteria bacterium]|nr:alpha/beta fold hydrolase [Gammaproteobacteria bacterium]
MPHIQRGKATIRYEEAGTGFPLLIIYGGGLNSRVVYPTGPFDAVAEFQSEYRCICMDLRNANGGESVGPLDFDDPWNAHTDDQLAVLDHLGVDRFMVMGFCIGNPLIWNLMQRAPGRIVASVHAQPSGVDPRYPDFFIKNNLSIWAPGLIASRPEISMESINRYLHKMYDGVEFVLTASREYVSRCRTPLLVLPDDVPAHPYDVAIEMARLAPEGQLSLFPWKDTRQNVAMAVRHIRSFLRASRPAV